VEISIIIPTFNEQTYVGRAVARAWATDPKEVIVVDGGSRDATAKRATSRGARVIRGPRGRARQQNIGAEEAVGRVLLFLHADNWLHAGALHQINEAMERTGVLGGAFCQRIEQPGAAYRILEWGNAARVRWLGLPYGDQGIFMRADIFRRLGGFPNVATMEDLLLMQRFRRLGRPALLPGPLHVSPRRWCRHGIVRQTLKNWSMLAAHRLGAQPEWLAGFYPPHGRRRTAHHDQEESATPPAQASDAQPESLRAVRCGAPLVQVPTDGETSRISSE